MAEERKTAHFKRGDSKSSGKSSAENEPKLCLAYLYRKEGCNLGDDCNFLHICRGYILQSCKASGHACKFSHDLSCRQPQALFQRQFGIKHLNGKSLHEFRELFAAVLQSPSVTGSGQQSSCGEEETGKHHRQKLRKFLWELGDIRDAKSSDRRSDLEGCSDGDYDEGSRDNLTGKKEPPKWPAAKQPQTEKEKQPTKICSFFVRGNCKFASHLGFRHCSSPFQWQIFDAQQHDWLDLTRQANDAIEEKFCNVNNTQFRESIMARSEESIDSTFYRATITFGVESFSISNDKSGRILDMRRLSTVSEAQPGRPNSGHSTQWIWYWQYDNQTWMQFLKPDDTSPLTSSTAIERKFLSFMNHKGPRQLDVTTRLGESKLDFSQMTLRIPESGYAHPLARRPKWQPTSEEKSLSGQSDPRGSKDKQLPATSQQTEPAVRPKARNPSRSSKVLQPSSSSNTSASASQDNQIACHQNQREFTYICPYFLRGRCIYEDDKYNHKRHFRTPYYWQFLDTTLPGAVWENIPSAENDRVERSFCNVNFETHECNSDAPGPVLYVYFDENQMHGSTEDIHLRRLSTSSSVLKTNWEKAFCTEWTWYWLDERHKWIVYSGQNAKGIQAGIDSATIEQKFVDYQSKDGEPVIEFTAGGQRYTLDFDAMEQTNVHYLTCRKVRRRPKFVAMEERKRLAKELSQAQSATVAVPTTWDNRGTQTEVKLVKLTDYTSPEYIVIANLFLDTMDDRGSIISIKRIQNLELWEDFTRLGDRMKKKNRGKSVLTKQLFHGTISEKHATTICNQNFDWRLCGINVGTKYGKGSYFARDAKFAHSYTQADELDQRYMFVVQVLVGTYAAGKLEYKRPPPRDPSKPLGDLYDSCVNNTSDPKIYVIFEKQQVYPEYLIKYYEKSHHQGNVPSSPNYPALPKPTPSLTSNPAPGYSQSPFQPQTSTSTKSSSSSARTPSSEGKLCSVQ